MLQDLHYAHLVMEIVPENDLTQVTLDIMGFNPAVFSGHPFRFKIKTTGDVKEVLSTSLRHFRLPKSWADFSAGISHHASK